MEAVASLGATEGAETATDATDAVALAATATGAVAATLPSKMASKSPMLTLSPILTLILSKHRLPMTEFPWQLCQIPP
jgi:hypothetical protein